MKKRFKYLFITTSALMSFGVAAAAVPQNLSSIVFAEDEEHKFDEVVTDWFTIRARSEKATDEKPEGVAELEILLSPVFQDYEKANGDSFSKFMDSKTGLIGAIKYILADQVKFIEPVEKDETRETETFEEEYEHRNSIFEQFLKAAFELDESYAVTDQDYFDEQYENYYDVMSRTFDDMNDQVINGGAKPSAGNFLRAVLAYFAGKTIEDETLTENDIADMLGVNSGEYTHSALGDALLSVYNNVDSLDSLERNQAVKNDIEVIYNDAVKIATGVKPESLAVAEIFMLVEETTIPVKTVVDILGVDTVKEAILDCFKDKDDNGATIANPISALAVNSMLKEFSSDTIYELCKAVAFTKDEIRSVIKDNMTNERLMELSKDLGKEGLDNVRIILGMANDNDVPSKLKAKRAATPIDDFNEHYNDFGEELVEIVLGRMSITDMIDAVEAVWVRNVGEDASEDHLLYSYNYPMDEQYAPFITSDTYTDGRFIHLRDIIEWFKLDFPKLSEIRTYDNENFKLQYHFEVLSPLNEGRLHCDLTVGFQEGKNVEPIRNILGILDDGIDLDFNFVEGANKNYEENTLQYNLTLKPRFFSNIYNFVYNSGFVFNTDDNRLKDRLFELTYMTFGEMKQKLNDLRAAQLIKDCKNLDYETAINTLLYYDKFVELFKGTPFEFPQRDGQTAEQAYMENIERIILNLKKFANKGDSLTYENIKKIVSEKLSEGLANKLNNKEFKDFLSDLVNLCAEIKAQHISLEAFRAIQNEDVYDYSDLLQDKEDTVNRFAKLIYKFVRAIPNEYNDYTIMDFFETEEARTITIKEGYNLVWKEILGMIPLGESFANTIDAFIAKEDKLKVADPTINIKLDANLQDGEPKVYTITYNYTEGGVAKTRKGLLPVGTDINDCGPGFIDGERVLYWADSTTGNRVEKMPEGNVVLGPVFTKKIDFSATTWNYVTPFEHDGLSHKVELKNLPEGLGTLYTITYFDNEKTAVGTYVASAAVQILNSEYKAEGFNPGNLTWKIFESEKQKISFKNTTWNYAGPFTYDGLLHEVKLIGLPEGLGTIYKVNYHDNENYKSGTYEARATIELIDKSYSVVDFNVGVLEWKILTTSETLYYDFNSLEEDDAGDSIIFIHINDGLASNPELHATRNDNAFDELAIDPDSIYGSKAVLHSAYDIEFKENNIKYDVSAYAGKVSVLIPEELRENKEFTIISLKNDAEFEKVSFEISEDGKYAIFNSEFISKVAIISALENLEGLFDPLPIIILIIGLTNIALCAFLLIYKKNKEEDGKKPSKKENKKTQEKPEPKTEGKEAKSKK